MAAPPTLTPVRAGLVAVVAWVPVVLVGYWLVYGQQPHSFHVLLAVLTSPFAFALGYSLSARRAAA